MGIGYKGKTLKEMVEERERSTAETGRCYGLDRLVLDEQDPITLTRFHWHITSACVAARETAKWVAGSPVLRSFGECLWMVTRPEGDVIAASLGLTGHVACTPEVIRSVIRQGFEERPGLKDGDIYFCADSLYGNPHNTDPETLVPIFYQGQLIAWAAAVIHVAEIGAALSPGSMAPISPNTFTDGFSFPPTRIGENFEVYPWWETTWMRKTRLGTINILDEKARITGCLMIREKILAMVDEYGLDYFEEATKEIFERERRTLERHILRETIPGRYRQASFRPYFQKGLVPTIQEANSNILDQQPLELRILPTGKLQIDAEGTSSAWWHADNALNPKSSLLGLYYWWMPTVIRETNGLNSSLMDQMEWIVPPGTRLNAAAFSAFAGQQRAPADNGRIGSSMSNMYSRARFARGILEEAIPMQIHGFVGGFGGTFENGRPWAASDFTGASYKSRAAGPSQDAVEFCGATANPQSDWQEVEELDMYYPPMVTLAKGLVPDFLTPGKNRGALHSNLVYLVYRPGQGARVNYCAIPNALYGDIASGISGGHPAIGCFSILFQDTNVMELISRGEGYPGDLREIWEWIQAGKLRVGSISAHPSDRPSTAVHEGDLYVCVGNGTTSWGDELERDPALVEADLNRQTISSQAARRLFGVMATKSDHAWRHDASATAELLESKRAERARRSIPAQRWWESERRAIKDKTFSDPLVSNLYRDALQRSKRWADEFTAFWQLPQDYQLEVQEI